MDTLISCLALCVAAVPYLWVAWQIPIGFAAVIAIGMRRGAGLNFAELRVAQGFVNWAIPSRQDYTVA